MRPQQLLLPGLRRPPPRPVSRRWAKRDFSAAEFARALARNGFRQLPGGLWFVDATDESMRFEAVCLVRPLRVWRRATLARIIRQRRHLKEQTK